MRITQARSASECVRAQWIGSLWGKSLRFGLLSPREGEAPAEPRLGGSLALPKLTQVCRYHLRFLIVLLIALTVGCGSNGSKPSTKGNGKKTKVKALDPDELERDIVALCAACHKFPPPASFTKEEWVEEVDRGINFALAAGRKLDSLPPRKEMIAYFQSRAPESRGKPERTPDDDVSPVTFRPHKVTHPAGPGLPGVTNVHWGRAPAAKGPLECFVCDTREKKLLKWQPGTKQLTVIADARDPAHVEVVDLDKDGHLDFLVAELGEFLPTNKLCGSISWLRYDPATKKYGPNVLATILGRVASARAADFDGDGDMDVIAAVFGFYQGGQVLLLENQTKDKSRPVFKHHKIIEQTGAVDVPIGDLNGDGKIDFVALMSQEHEQIVAYINQGNGKFKAERVFDSDDPAYGSSGLQLVDMDKDGDLDILYTNGDSVDAYKIKTYHSIQWLENKGKFPFVHHHLTHLPGVQASAAADMDGDGDMDIVAVSWLPYPGFAEIRKQEKLDSIIWLEQKTDKKFQRHTIERQLCDHATVAIADYDGDGDLDFATGNLTLDGWKKFGKRRFPKVDGWVTIWENVGKR